MKNQIKKLQEFPFTLKPVTISSGAHQGEAEIHLREQFTPAKMEGDTRVASASVGTRNHAEMALVLFQKNAAILETDDLRGPCIVRTAEGLQAGRLSGHHGTTEGMCVMVADLKRLAGRPLAMARLGAVKTKLAQKYGRLAAQSGSVGRRDVLTHKALGYRRSAQYQWQMTFRTLARSTGVPSTSARAN